MAARETGRVRDWADGAGAIRPHHMPRETGDVTFTAADVIEGVPRVGAFAAYTLAGPEDARRAVRVRVRPC